MRLNEFRPRDRKSGIGQILCDTTMLGPILPINELNFLTGDIKAFRLFQIWETIALSKIAFFSPSAGSGHFNVQEYFKNLNLLHQYWRIWYTVLIHHSLPLGLYIISMKKISSPIFNFVLRAYHAPYVIIWSVEDRIRKVHSPCHAPNWFDVDNTRLDYFSHDTPPTHVIVAVRRRYSACSLNYII